ncbi:MAG: NAD(+) synthetase [Candidatus Zixiibacteriota bacterium]|nr:MAG: NAD(+) synthetase [candidate division Zixibacteria bacterium]
MSTRIDICKSLFTCWHKKVILSWHENIGIGMPKINEANTAQRLETFIKNKLKESGLDGYVIGLSGGIDSSLSATIAVKAVGSKKVLGMILPYLRSSDQSEKDAFKLADFLDIKAEKVDISPMINAYYEDIEKIDNVRAGNKMARERMSILFDRAFAKNLLVLGTSNRTEICLGYGTWHGDMACSVNPIGMLYKIEVRAMAEYYGIPESIRSKKPSADLWPGQTDEGELGLEYEKVDRLLYKLIEEGVADRNELNEAGFDDNFIDKTIMLINRFYFKRHLPEIADLGLKKIPDKIILSGR